MEYTSIRNIFKNRYVVPCFQREYSWENEEITDLLNDIKKCDKELCLGIITTKTENGKTLLIDGQQRLTTLYMIAIISGYIDNKDQILLENELAKEFKLLKGKEDNDDNAEFNDLKILFEGKTNVISSNLAHGWNIIKSNIRDDKQIIKNNLDKIMLYVINLDDDVDDLNHYFEVMNSRGVQLSRSDIVKAILMNPLDLNNKYKLNNLWYALEDMKDIPKSWNNFNSISTKTKEKSVSIKTILKKSVKKKLIIEDDNNLDKDDNIILNLDYFLLYVIRLYNDINGVEIQNKMFDLEDLDDEYRKLFENSTEKDVIKFLDFLIKTKRNYEKYIVKYNNNESIYEIGIKDNKYKKDIETIQACLRVSFHDRKSMHWIYKTLKYFNDENNNKRDYVMYIRDFIRGYIEAYIKENEKCNYATGTYTPHIVLNYLDYLFLTNHSLLESKIDELKMINFKKYNFKVRSSVEHYMPRQNEKGYKWVDDIGNLALLAYKTNTHIQNAEPSEKNKYFENHNISDYSIKLQIMYYMSKSDPKSWHDTLCFKLRDKCIGILKDDLKEYNICKK